MCTKTNHEVIAILTSVTQGRNQGWIQREYSPTALLFHTGPHCRSLWETLSSPKRRWEYLLPSLLCSEPHSFPSNLTPSCFHCYPRDRGSFRAATACCSWATQGLGSAGTVTVTMEVGFPCLASDPEGPGRVGVPTPPPITIAAVLSHSQLSPAPVQPNWSKWKQIWSFPHPWDSGESRNGRWEKRWGGNMTWTTKRKGEFSPAFRTLKSTWKLPRVICLHQLEGGRQPCLQHKVAAPESHFAKS